MDKIVDWLMGALGSLAAALVVMWRRQVALERRASDNYEKEVEVLTQVISQLTSSMREGGLAPPAWPECIERREEEKPVENDRRKGS